MSGANPEVTRNGAAQELARLEPERMTQRPRKGSLAARLAQERKAADKALRLAERRVALARRAESILRASPDLTETQLRQQMKRGR